jgi:hypothetical protein
MNIVCNRCGTEFDGNFCPKCGNQNYTNQSDPSSTQANRIPPYMPNIGQPLQPPKKKRGCLTAILVTVGILIIVGIIGSQIKNDEPKAVDPDSESSNITKSASDTSDDTKDDATATPLPEKTTFGIGETVELKDILVTLVSVKISEGGDYNKPSDGNEYLLCEFNIENNSDNDIAVSSMISFEAYCDDYSITQSISALLDTEDLSQLDGSVAAGKKMNGIIGYEVSKDWKELEISYTPTFWSGKDITFIAENK